MVNVYRKHSAGGLMKHTHIVKGVLPGSIAQEMEIEAGDRLL